MRDWLSVGGTLLLALSLVILFTPPVQAQPQRFALVVGVKEYTASEKLTKLPYAEEDAAKLAETLGKIGYDVTLMTQKASEGENRRRFAPTATQLRKEFETLVKTPFLKKADCVVVTLAGHGIQLPSKDDPKKTAYFFCPEDARIDDLTYLEDVADKHNLISVDEFYANLQNCQAGVRLLVVDACRNDPNQPGAFRSSNSITRPPVPAPPGGIAALFSCSANERAVEDANLKHGVFSHFLIEALSGNADTDQDKELTIAEIQSYVGQRTFNFVRKNYGRQQLPELSGTIQGWAALGSLVPGKPMTPDKPLTPPMEHEPLVTFEGSQAGDVWEKNSLNIKFSWCPPGKFTMGSPLSQTGRWPNEGQVSVTLTQGFWLARYEVTQAEWTRIMGSSPWKGQENSFEGARHPAAWMKWDDASRLCQKLTELGRSEGWLPADWKFDLPTEAQWEYACRAGTTTRFSFGDDDRLLSEYGWWGGFQGDGNTASDPHSQPVGLKKANPWGLYDIHGNVTEWCKDWYAEQLPGGTDPEVRSVSAERLVKGGGWAFPTSFARSAQRINLSTENGYFDVGMRLAIVPATPGKPGKPPMENEPLVTFEGSQAGDVWEKNSLQMKFGWCPPGKFMMGSPAGTSPYEYEDHVSVTLSQGFWIGQHEVTQSAWTRIMGSAPWKGQQGVREGASYPATWVNWEEASEFCQKLTALGRREKWLPADWSAQLPTDAQWEYACRAGTRTSYSFGDDESRLSQYGWYETNALNLGEAYPHQVGLKKANPWGLHDFHGNVWEWCRDKFTERSPGGTDPDFQGAGENRIRRGGCWDFHGGVCRSAHRNQDTPTLQANYLGFRVVLVQTAK